MTMFIHIIINCFIYFIFIWGMVVLTKNAYLFSYQIFGKSAVEKEPGTEVLVTIHKGDSTKEIARLLEQKNVIKNEDSFFLRAKLMVNSSDPILPGVYQLNNSMNYGDIIEIITNPNENLDHD